MPTTITLSVSESADDAYEAEAGNVTITSSGTVDTADEWYGFRFAAVPIQRQAPILSAYLGVVPIASGADEPDHPIYAEASDNAALFTTDANNVSGRSRTNAIVTWSSADLGADGTSRHNSPDLAALLQEVINRDGWQAGNALALLVRGSADIARDLAVSHYDDDPALAAQLQITYGLSEGGGGGSLKTIRRRTLAGVRPQTADVVRRTASIARPRLADVPRRLR